MVNFRGFDDVKKWELICDQEQVNAREPPSTYLSKLRTYLGDPSASRSAKKRKNFGNGGSDGNSTQVRNLKQCDLCTR